MQKKIVTSAFSKAYQAWFSDYDHERRRQKKRMGARLVGFPEPPTNPEVIAQVIDQVGTTTVLQVLGVHRSTVARWLAGRSVIPRASWLILVLLAEGRLPGMSSDWRDFRFVGDRLHLVGTNVSYSAREIAGWQYQTAHAASLARSLEASQAKIAYLLRIGQFEAQNDALIHTG